MGAGAMPRARTLDSREPMALLPHSLPSRRTTLTTDRDRPDAERTSRAFRTFRAFRAFRALREPDGRSRARGFHSRDRQVGPGGRAAALSGDALSPRAQRLPARRP